MASGTIVLRSDTRLMSLHSGGTQHNESTKKCKLEPQNGMYEDDGAPVLCL